MLPILAAAFLLHLPNAAHPAAVLTDAPPTEAQRDYDRAQALFKKGDYDHARIY